MTSAAHVGEPGARSRVLRLASPRSRAHRHAVYALLAPLVLGAASWAIVGLLHPRTGFGEALLRVVTFTVLPASGPFTWVALGGLGFETVHVSAALLVGAYCLAARTRVGTWPVASVAAAAVLWFGTGLALMLSRALEA